jgi:hypothetical protein
MKRPIWLLTAVFVMLGPCFAWAHGDIVQLRGTRGPFSVTVFVSPQVTLQGPADVSILVQRRERGDVVLNANVDLIAAPPAGRPSKDSDPICGFSSVAVASRSGDLRAVEVRAMREQAFNKLLYAARLKLNATGDWPLHIIVSEGADAAGFDVVLSVTATSGKLQGIWPYLALPPLAIAAFAINQHLRRRALEKGF